MLSMFQTDSLKKIRNHDEYLNTINTEKELQSVKLLKGERFTYEVLISDDTSDLLEVTVSSDLSVKSYIMKKVPCDYPTYETSTGPFITRKEDFIPDLLLPLESQKNIISVNSDITSLVLSVTVPDDYKKTESEVTVTVTKQLPDGTSLSEMRMLSIHVLDTVLTKDEIMFTQWFHTDCISVLHNTGIYTEKHWEMIEKYMKTARALGINIILTPVFTPALDTAIGKRRPSVQLVKIIVNGDLEDEKSYSFDFSLVDKFMSLAEGVGIKNFEISHLFTQWGLKYAPNIEATVNGEKKFIFGWDTESHSTSYVSFLKAFLPSLISHLEEKNRLNHCYFHLSDEPSKEHLENYKFAHNLVKPYLKGRPIMDAISDVDFYKNNFIDIPVTASNHLKDFLKLNIENQWTYTCCAQHIEMGNRFIAMPSFRNRILGLQMYKYDIKGFLHWGYNFFYTAGSLYPINPYLTTSADKCLPSGDPFTVYPGIDGPLLSIRGLVFYDALQDIRILKTVEEKVGREKLINLIDKENESPLTFEKYAKNPQMILNVISKVKDLL